MSTTEQILDQVSRLTEPQQKRVLEFAKALSQRPVGVPVAELKKFAGTIPPEGLTEMRKAIEEDCERINPDAW